MAQAMVTSSLMHASILRSGKQYVDEEAEADFLRQCFAFAGNYAPGHRPPAPQRTFAQHWSTRCEAHWGRAFKHFAAGATSPHVLTSQLPAPAGPLLTEQVGAGMVAFIVNLILAAWIKFRVDDRASWTAAIISVTLVLSMLGMFKSMYEWAPHLSLIHI